MRISRNEKRTIVSERKRYGIRPAVLLRGVFAIVVLWLVFRFVASANGTFRAIREADLRFLALAVTVGVVGEVITSYKWRWLLGTIGQPVRLWFAVRACYIGMFYNNLLPGSLGGDIAKSVLARDASGGLSRAAASVFMQRNTGFAALLIVAIAAACFPPLRMKVFPDQLALLNYAGVWFAVLAVLYLAANLVLMSERMYRVVWSSVIRFMPGAAMRAWAQRFQRLHFALLLYRRAFPFGIALSLLTQLIDCLLVLLVFRAVGTDVSYWRACVFAPASTLAALVPLSINGIGLREAIYAALFTSLAVAPEQAVAASLVHYGVILFMAGIGALVQLLPSGSPEDPLGESNDPPPTA